MNGQMLNAALAQAQQQPVGVQVAMPMNDAQLVSLIAAQLQGNFEGPQEIVALAVDIVAHSVVAVNTGMLANRVKALVREVEAERRRAAESN